MTISKYPVFVVATILCAAFSLFAQTPRRDFNRPQTFDAQHYIIRTSFDRAAKKVLGDTTISLKPLNAGFSSVELDAEDLAFESVKLEPEGRDLKFAALRGKVVVTLDKAYGPSDVISIRLKYTASPKKGVYFVDADQTHSAQIWTQGEPDEARHWFPSFDFPSDKATTEQIITVDGGDVVVANGELLSRRPNSNGSTTWHYKMPVPHAVYLVSFVIGRYNKIEEKYKDIPLGYYIYPGREATARRAYAETKDMMQIMEDLTGVAYPYNKYDQTVVASFQFGGMENITATTMADTEIFFADFDFGIGPVRDLVSHELAHSWFGNLVTCRNWAELWLNEGFATFMEAAYLERSRDRATYMAKIRSDAGEFLAGDSSNRRRHGLFNHRADEVSALFDNASTTYQKGSAIVHTLREQVGNDAFWKAIKIYLDRHRFGSVETTDLQRVMEEASGQDLKWFFDQWIYGGGSPRLDVSQSYNARQRTVTLTISQTQSADGLTPSIFRLPLDIEIKSGVRATNEKIDLTKRIQTFTIKVPARPTNLTIDKEEKIPVKTVKIRPLRVVR